MNNDDTSLIDTLNSAGELGGVILAILIVLQYIATTIRNWSGTPLERTIRHELEFLRTYLQTLRESDERFTDRILEKLLEKL